MQVLSMNGDVVANSSSSKHRDDSGVEGSEGY